MHDNIVRFEQKGLTLDTAQAREWLVDEIERQMRDSGYAPSIDNEPQFTVEYSADSEAFNYTLSVFGVKVKEDPWKVSGVTRGKTIMKHTQKTK